jgi:hypothetical protein
VIAIKYGALVTVLASVLYLATWRGPTTHPGKLPAGGYNPPALPQNASAELSLEDRSAALRRARVWQPPAIPIEQFDFSRNPAELGPIEPDATISCKYFPEKVGGLTPKFECILNGGQVVKVKYGPHNREVFGEVAAARLLTAMGFATDAMYVVKRVRCYGCSESPFAVLLGLRYGVNFQPHPDFDSYVEFEPAVIERKFDANSIEAPSIKGWAWHELDQINPSEGGSTRGEVDALRLTAVFIAHWDNKAENQRLACMEKDYGRSMTSGSQCEHPIAMLQDLGSTFGPLKVDLNRWAASRIWKDQSGCTVSMRSLPYHGGTFQDVAISEAGRRIVAEQLSKLSSQQIEQLFEAARFPQYSGHSSSEWARIFEEKTRAIVERPPCPY